MGIQTIDLLTNVRLGRQQCQLLSQTLLGDRRGLLENLGDLLLHPLTLLARLKIGRILGCFG